MSHVCQVYVMCVMYAIFDISNECNVCNKGIVCSACNVCSVFISCNFGIVYIVGNVCNAMQCNVMKWNGMPRNVAKCNGTE